MQYELKESTIGPSLNVIQQNQFTDFIYNTVRDDFYVLDKKFIYMFTFRKNKYQFSHSKFIHGKDTKFLLCSSDGKRVFTLKENKICVRNTENFTKILNIKLSMKNLSFFSDSINLLNDERVMMALNSQKSDLYGVDMLTQNTVFSLNIGSVNNMHLSKNCNLLVLDNYTSLFLFRVLRTFNPPKVFPNILPKERSHISHVAPKKNFDQDYAKIVALIDGNKMNEAVLYIRKLNKEDGETP